MTGPGDQLDLVASLGDVCVCVCVHSLDLSSLICGLETVTAVLNI